eukprot:gene3470-13531_t
MRFVPLLPLLVGVLLLGAAAQDPDMFSEDAIARELSTMFPSDSPPSKCMLKRLKSVNAFLWAFPLVNTARSFAASGFGTQFQAEDMNSFKWQSQLSNSNVNTIVSPNVNTLYGPAFFDLTAGAIELTVSDTLGRYYSLQCMDFWGFTFGRIGFSDATDVDSARALTLQFSVAAPALSDSPACSSTIAAAALILKSTSIGWNLLRLAASSRNFQNSSSIIVTNSNWSTSPTIGSTDTRAPVTQYHIMEVTAPQTTGRDDMHRKILIAQKQQLEFKLVRLDSNSNYAATQLEHTQQIFHNIHKASVVPTSARLPPVPGKRPLKRPRSIELPKSGFVYASRDGGSSASSSCSSQSSSSVCFTTDSPGQRDANSSDRIQNLIIQSHAVSVPLKIRSPPQEISTDQPTLPRSTSADTSFFYSDPDILGSQASQPSSSLSRSSSLSLAARRSFASRLSVHVRPPVSPTLPAQANPAEPSNHVSTSLPQPQQPHHKCPSQDSCQADESISQSQLSDGTAMTCIHQSQEEASFSRQKVDGWFSKCRGCAQLTGKLYSSHRQEIPFCQCCTFLLKRLHPSQEEKVQEHLAAIHVSWLKDGL